MTLSEETLREAVTTVLDERRIAEDAAKLLEETQSVVDQTRSVQSDLNATRQELAGLRDIVHGQQARLQDQVLRDLDRQRGAHFPSRQAAIAERAQSANMQGGTLRTGMGPRDELQYRSGNQ